jgi:SAM-dependent methyltransferase
MMREEAFSERERGAEGKTAARHPTQKTSSTRTGSVTHERTLEADRDGIGGLGATGVPDVVASGREARPLYTRTASRDPRESMRVKILRALDLWLRDATHAKRVTPAEQTRHRASTASASVGAYLNELPTRDVDVLDFGCGSGRDTIWLASQVRSVVGVDADGSRIAQARRALKATPLRNCAFAPMVDGRIPLAGASVDAVFSTDAFERVLDPEFAFREVARVLRPGGLLISRFGPLFYSPYGYQMTWACGVPYAHLLFGLNAVLALARERRSHLVEVRSWQGAGLNCRRFREFKEAAIGAGLSLKRFEPIPVRGLRRLTRVPLFGDLFIFGVDCVAQRPGATHPTVTNA